MTIAHNPANFMRTAQRTTPEQWSAALERRALLAGMPAVIGGVVREPSSQEAYEALMRLYAPHFKGDQA